MSGTYSTNKRDPEADVAEGKRLLRIIDESTEYSLTQWEEQFLESVSDQLEGPEWISEKQLHHLRTIKDKAIEAGGSSRAARFRRNKCGRNRFFDLDKAERAASATRREVEECADCSDDEDQEVWHIV